MAKAKLTDTKLAKLAQEYSDLRNRAKAIEAKAEKRKLAIIEEMERRGVKALETEEVRVSYVRKSNVSYDPMQLKENLGARKFKLITTEVVDKDKLATAVQEGKVDLELVEKCSKVSYNRPYIVVSGRGKDA